MCKAFAVKVEKQLTHLKRRQAIFELLGKEFVNQYFPEMENDPNVLVGIYRLPLLFYTNRNVTLNCVFFSKIFFCWTKVHFVGPLNAPYFGIYVTLPFGFKARVVLSPALLLACA